MSSVVNISGYQFVDLDGLTELREVLLTCCLQKRLKGTILLSEEGINCFLAGDRSGIDSFLERLRSIDGLESFEAKESLSSYQPFSRMLVKIKKEIITFDMPDIQPAKREPRKMDAVELKKWLDESRDFLLLDTRNQYEIELGTFEKAVDVKIDNFREFPDAIQSLPEETRSKPVVMFCTGGIRCEKAGPFMEDAGFENVLQLDGGILKYFEKCGAEHWEGECFVFDKRVALDPQLSETATTLCYVCQAVLSEVDQQHPDYSFGVSCPNCVSNESNEEGTIVLDVEERRKQFLARVSPLPGSIPYENFRPMSVSRSMDGLPLLDFLEGLRTHLDRTRWKEAIEAGHILFRGKPVGMERKVTQGQKYYHLLPDTIEPDVNFDVKFLYEDDEIVVIDKPAPLPMHPCGRFNRNSLQNVLQEVYSPGRLRLVHRLDANTTGLVVYSRNKPLAVKLHEQFTQGRIEKQYFVQVHGIPVVEQFHSDQRIAKHPGEGGIRFLDPQGQVARTDFKVIGNDGNQAFLEACPRTGRTNQIRLHLWDLGFPVCGDPTYLPDGRLGTNQTLAVEAPAMKLHAYRISFQHPITGKPLEFSTDRPGWFPAK